LHSDIPTIYGISFRRLTIGMKSVFVYCIGCRSECDWGLDTEAISYIRVSRACPTATATATTPERLSRVGSTSLYSGSLWFESVSGVQLT
jgi:hypothetical protein